jgi:hypothetical protein
LLTAALLLKQMAQAVTLAVAGLQHLSNEVEVSTTVALITTGVEGRAFVFTFSINEEQVHEW